MKTALRVHPIGGLGEIGLNCMVLEFGDDLIVIDCGVMFSDQQLLGVDFAIPDMSYLKANAQRIRAYLITHGHEDHIGALPFAIKAHPAPIYCTPFAKKLVASKLQEHGCLSRAVFREFELEKPVKVGTHFHVTPVSVTHSIIEALALLIDTPIGKVVFTGDFKIDPTPYYGKPMDLTPFEKIGEDGALLLLSDSTNVEREGHSLSEKEVFHALEEIMPTVEGLTIVSVFASNIARIGQVIELARRLGKKVALLGRSMDQNSRLAQELGYLKGLSDVQISIDELEDYPRNQCVILSTGSQGEGRSALARLSVGEMKSPKLQPGDLVILSSKFIPGNEKAIGRMINNIFRQGAEVLYEAVADIHVSGHANAQELRRMIESVRPKFFIPVHGEYRHLVRHSRLAGSCGISESNRCVAVNGDFIEVTANRLQIVDHVEENRILIEGEGGADVSKVILKDRRKVALGIVFSVIIRNSANRMILAGPEIFSRGLFEEGAEPDLFEDAKDVVCRVLKASKQSVKSSSADLQEEIRVGLRRFFNERIGKKPVVLPIVIDI